MTMEELLAWAPGFESCMCRLNFSGMYSSCKYTCLSTHEALMREGINLPLSCLRKTNKTCQSHQCLQVLINRRPPWLTFYQNYPSTFSMDLMGCSVFILWQRWLISPWMLATWRPESITGDPAVRLSFHGCRHWHSLKTLCPR